MKKIHMQKQRYFGASRTLAAAILTLAFLASSLTACGTIASRSEKNSERTASAGAYDEDSAIGYEEKAFLSDSAIQNFKEMPAAAVPDSEISGMSGDEAVSGGLQRQNGSDTDTKTDTARKLIRNVSLDVETNDYDHFIRTIQDQIVTLGGYVESSELYGSNDYEHNNRSANFIFRLPKPSVDDFLTFTEGNSNLLHKYETTQDITLQYADTEGRKKALQIEYDRLLELLSKADNIDVIITLESRLSELRYQLDSFESDLRRYDNQVDYSTITMNIQERRVLTPQKEAGFWAKVASGLAENLNALMLSLIDFLIWFFSTVPLFLLPLLIVIFLVRYLRKARKNRKLKKENEQKTAVNEREKSSPESDPSST